MKLWMIKRMSDKKLKEWINATKKVLGFYIGELPRFQQCPFCALTRHYKSGSRMNCHLCLWEIIDNIHCCAFANKNNVVMRTWPEIRARKEWTEQRIPILKAWMKILRAEIKRRKKS